MNEGNPEENKEGTDHEAMLESREKRNLLESRNEDYRASERTLNRTGKRMEKRRVQNTCMGRQGTGTGRG